MEVRPAGTFHPAGSAVPLYCGEECDRQCNDNRCNGLAYTKSFDGFCLVSSDSDFTRLASRIREEGLLVYGFGEKKTPKAFVSACDKFIFTEVLRFQEDVESAVKPKTANELKRDAKLVAFLRSALEAASDDSGWAHLGAVGK